MDRASVSGDVAGRLSAGLAAAVDDLLAVEADTLTVAEVGWLLEAVERDRNRLDAARTKLLASFARRRGFRDTGHKHLAHWMQARLRRSPSQARKEAATAERLAGLSATAEALDDGEISLEHAAAIAEHAGQADDVQAAQRRLLDEARAGDPRRVAKAGRRLARDADRRADEDAKVARAHRQRTLSLRADEDAKTMWIDGRLPLLAGMQVRAAIDALAVPTGRDDPRSYGQRMADGLVALAARAAGSSAGGLPSRGGLPVELTAIVPVEVLERRAGVPPGTVSGGPGGATDLSDAELDELVCAAGLSWLITDAAGVPLRYGRTRRYASPDQRRVLAARDGGCRMPGCDAPPDRCLAHHEPPFDRPGGATDIDRMVLLCASDHDRRHHGGWGFELDEQATVTVTSPDGSTVLTETAAEARARHGTCPLTDDRPSSSERDGPPGPARAGPRRAATRSGRPSTAARQQRLDLHDHHHDGGGVDGDRSGYHVGLDPGTAA